MAELPAWLIVPGALAVSFWTQVNTVAAHGFAYWEALVWGTSTDFGTLSFLFLAREGAHRGTPTWGAWLGSIACALMSVQYNVVRAIEAGDWLAVEAHLWMPTLGLATWFWLLHGRQRRWNLHLPRRIRKLSETLAVNYEAPDGETRSGASPAKLPVAKPRRNLPNGETRPGQPAHVPPPAVTEVVAGMRRDGKEVTARTLAAELDVSERSARRYLAALPRVV